MLNFDEDQLIERAKKAYYAAADRVVRQLGEFPRQLPALGWECIDEHGKVTVVCYHGDIEPIVRYRFAGGRLRRLCPK